MRRARQLDRDVAVAMGWTLTSGIGGFQVYARPSHPGSPPLRMAVSEWKPSSNMDHSREFAQFVRRRVDWKVYRRALSSQMWPEYHDPVVEHDLDMQSDWDFEDAWGSTPEQICIAGLAALRKGAIVSHDALAPCADEDDWAVL